MSDEFHTCVVCDQPIDAEYPHSYHEPGCGWEAQVLDGSYCICEGYCHERCCPICLAQESAGCSCVEDSDTGELRTADGAPCPHE